MKEDTQGSTNAYDIAYQRAIHPETREHFWKEQAELV